MVILFPHFNDIKPNALFRWRENDRTRNNADWPPHIDPLETLSAMTLCLTAPMAEGPHEPASPLDEI